jgi:hypothetical protein
LADVAYAQGFWVGAFVKSKRQTKNAYIIRESWDELRPAIKEKFDVGYQLLSVQYGDGSWFATLAVDDNITASAVNKCETLDDFMEVYETRKENGYKLVSFASRLEN